MSLVFLLLLSFLSRSEEPCLNDIIFKNDNEKKQQQIFIISGKWKQYKQKLIL